MLNELVFAGNFAIAVLILVGTWQPISVTFHGRTQSVLRGFLVSFLFIPCRVAVGHGGGLIPSAAFMAGTFVLNGFRDPLAMAAIGVQCASTMLIPFIVFSIAFEVWRAKAGPPGVSAETKMPRKIEFGRKVWIIVLFALIVAILTIMKPYLSDWAGR